MNNKNNDILILMGKIIEQKKREAKNKKFKTNKAVLENVKRLYRALIANGDFVQINVDFAFGQLTLVIETMVFHFHQQEIFSALSSADVLCIDALLDGTLHIEIVFNNAFIECANSEEGYYE